MGQACVYSHLKQPSTPSCLSLQWLTQLPCDVIFLITHGCFQKTLGLELPGQVRWGRFTLIVHLSLLQSVPPEGSNLLIQAGCDYSSLLTLVEVMVSFASWEFVFLNVNHLIFIKKYLKIMEPVDHSMPAS